MNPNANSLSRIHEIISKGLAGAIVVPTNASVDALAAATSLYLGLNKLGKSISLAAANEVNAPEIAAADKFQSNLVSSGNNLIISFPYSDGSIDKVDYNIQGNFFNLIITPRANYPKLDPSQVKYSYTGGNLDFIIAIDAPNLNSLGAIYADNQDKFQGKDIINIDRHLTNSFYGSANYVNKTASSISEMVFKILQDLGIEIDKEIATNLYLGITSATNNFSSYSVNADTFETVAQLMRLGAVKKTAKKPTFPGFSNPGNLSVAPSQSANKEIRSEKPIEVIEKEPKQEPPPQDWLKPKIFHGGGDLI